MENRFFDIDNNVYLNGLYLVVLICGDNKNYKLEEINLKLFIMKNPHILLNVCEYLKIEISRELFYEYQYSNLQSEMTKYLLKVQVKGLIEAINFLYSKGLIEVNYQRNNLHATEKCIDMNLNEIPQNIIDVANKVNSIFQKITINDLKKILFVEGDYLNE